MKKSHPNGHPPIYKATRGIVLRVYDNDLEGQVFITMKCQ
jgi:hypothetical protein